MRQIISIIYGVLLIAIWICVMGIVIAVFDSGGPEWLLAAAGFVAVVSSVALVEELLEWRTGPKARAPGTLEKISAAYRRRVVLCSLSGVRSNLQ
jgi:hypothetical protein